MLRLGGSPPPPPPSLSNTTPLETLSQSLPFPSKTHQTHLSFLSNGLTHHSFRAILSPLRMNSSVFSLKSRRKGSPTRSAISEEEVEDEIEEEEEEEEEDEEDEDEDEFEEEEDEDEDEFVPLRNMKEWYANKPRGIGEGKVYDTSIEDKLAEEIERSRRAQLANINKLKNSPPPRSTSKPSKGVLLKKKAPEDVPSGIRVHLVNLPKKKNVHRDLQKAFKGVPGIVDVIPAVTGNEKTRDPICKGYASVYLKNEEDANRFVKLFSRQSITFGKIQKQVRCEIINPKSPRSAVKLSLEVNDHASHAAIPGIAIGKIQKPVRSEKMNPKSPSPALKPLPDVNDCASHVAISNQGESTVASFDRINDAPSYSGELIAPNDSEDEDDEYVPAQQEEVEENLESLSLSKHSDGNGLGTSTVARFDRMNDAPSDSGELIAPDDSEEDIEYVPAQQEGVEENLESLSLSTHSDEDGLEMSTETVAVSMPSKHKEKTVENRKKLKAKRKRTNVPKFKLPGSANRLRVKEKAVLTGVFSKYAAQAASASKGKP